MHLFFKRPKLTPKQRAIGVLKFVAYFGVSYIIYSTHARADKSFTPIYVKAPIANELSGAEAKDILDSNPKASVFVCNEQFIKGSGKIGNAPGTKVYAKGPLSGEKSKYKVRRAIKSGETWMLCAPQYLDERTDNLTRKS